MKVFLKSLIICSALMSLPVANAAAMPEEVGDYSSSKELQKAKVNLIWSNQPPSSVQPAHPFTQEYGLSKLSLPSAKSYLDCLLSIVGADGFSEREEGALLKMVPRFRIHELLPAEDLPLLMGNIQGSVQKAKDGGYKGANVVDLAETHAANLRELVSGDVEGKDLKKAASIAMLCDALVIAGADGLADEEIEAAKQIADSLGVSKEFGLIKQYAELSIQLDQLNGAIQSFNSDVSKQD